MNPPLHPRFDIICNFYPKNKLPKKCQNNIDQKPLAPQFRKFLKKIRSGGSKLSLVNT